MGFQYWFTVCATLILGPLALFETFRYMHRGIYTKTFKGTRRREYIHKDEKPIEFWFSIVAQFVMSGVLIGIGIWFLDEIPAVHHLYSQIREVAQFW